MRMTRRSFGKWVGAALGSAVLLPFVRPSSPKPPWKVKRSIHTGLAGAAEYPPWKLKVIEGRALTEEDLVRALSNACRHYPKDWEVDTFVLGPPLSPQQVREWIRAGAKEIRLA